MADLTVDKSPSNQKTKSETSISNSEEIRSARNGPPYSAAHYRLTAKKLHDARKAAASKPVKKSNTSAVKRTTGKGSKTSESATKKRKVSRNKSTEKKTVAKKPKKTSKMAGGKKQIAGAKGPKKKAAAAKAKKPNRTSKNASG